MVARLSTEKGHIYLLRAMPEVVREFPDIKLVLVGDGPLKGQLKELTHQLHLDKHVIFTGFYKDSIEACSLFDVFVHSSLNESLSMVISEAMQLGKPVIATTVGANRDLVSPGENGYLVPPRDEYELGRAIIRLLSDKTRLRQYSSASQEIMKRKFSPPVITRQYEELYTYMTQGNED